MFAPYIDNRGLFEQLEAEDERVRRELKHKRDLEERELLHRALENAKARLLNAEADRERIEAEERAAWEQYERENLFWKLELARQNAMRSGKVVFTASQIYLP